MPQQHNSSKNQISRLPELDDSHYLQIAILWVLQGHYLYITNKLEQCTIANQVVLVQSFQMKLLSNMKYHPLICPANQNQ